MTRDVPAAGLSHALIIATDRYADQGLSDLLAPSHDAEEFGKVLEDPTIGGFTIKRMLNEPGDQVREEIEGFFAERHPGELLILYLSGHGIKDVSGRLYFAAATTKLNRLAASGISASFIYEQVERSRAGKVLLLLDCCYSGAYLKGHRARDDERVRITEIRGRGRAVITSLTAVEYSFEINAEGISGTSAPSVFTSALVEGLRSGNADRDADGLVSVDDLYGYTYDRVRELTPYQTPEKKWGDVRGDFIIAKSPKARPATLREPLPIEITEALGNPSSRVREVAIKRLAALAFGRNQGLALTAREVLQALADDDSPEVLTAAMAALAETYLPPEMLDPAASGPDSAARDAAEEHAPGAGTSFPVSNDLLSRERGNLLTAATSTSTSPDETQDHPDAEDGNASSLPSEEAISNSAAPPRHPDKVLGSEHDSECPEATTENGISVQLGQPDSVNAATSRWPGSRRIRLATALVALSMVVIVSAVGIIWRYQARYANYLGPGTGTVVVRVMANEDTRSLGMRLVSLGVIRAPDPFVTAVRDSDGPRDIKPGYYQLRKHMNATLASKVLLNPALRLKVAEIPAGLRMPAVLRMLSATTRIPIRNFSKVLRGTSLGLPSSAKGDPEGYLSPGTYFLPPGASAQNILKLMVGRFREVSASIGLRSRNGGYPLSQIVTVASLLQAEDVNPRYYPQLARVIYNRLRGHLPLMLDGTVLYAIKPSSLPLTAAQLQVASPYNTYLHRGLPPGPIDSPGREALEGALHPSNGDWLYFVTLKGRPATTRFTDSSSVFNQLEARLGGGILALSCHITGYLSSHPGFSVEANVGTGSAYLGRVIIQFSDGYTSHRFSPAGLNAGVSITNLQPWTGSGLVPTGDIGASTQPNSCSAASN